MLGGIAEGITEVRGFLESEDCLATMKAMRALGVRVEQTGPQEVRVHGVGLRGLKAAGHALDMGNSGTAMRLMTGLLAGQSFDSELIGDSSLMKRPMERAADAAAPDGRADRDAGRQAAGEDLGGAALTRHPLRAAGRQRAGEVGRAAGRAVCEGRHDGDRAGGHARSHRAHAAQLRLLRSTLRTAKCDWSRRRAARRARWKCPAISRPRRSSWSRARSAAAARA